MIIKVAEKKYSLSEAQTKVVNILLSNRGDHNVYVVPSNSYNYQRILGIGEWGEIFKRPTLDCLVQREILVPTGVKNYLQLNPLVHRVFNS